MSSCVSASPTLAEADDGSAEVLVETLPIVPRRPVVLVLDSESRVRTVLGVMLGRHGFAVLKAADGREALELCRERGGALDAVLLDADRLGPEGAALREEIEALVPDVRFCPLGGLSSGVGRSGSAERFFARVPRPLRPDDLVRNLWLLITGAAPSLDAAEADGLEGAPSEEDRRGAVRHPSGLAPHCYPLSGPPGDRWSGRLRDVSASGVQLFLDRPLEPGMILVLELPGEAEAPRRRFVARVVRTASAPGGWIVGCAFARQLSKPRLDALLRESSSDQAGKDPEQTREQGEAHE